MGWAKYDEDDRELIWERYPAYTPYTTARDQHNGKLKKCHTTQGQIYQETTLYNNLVHKH